jgi:hypothetical protein
MLTRQNSGVIDITMVNVSPSTWNQDTNGAGGTKEIGSPDLESRKTDYRDPGYDRAATLNQWAITKYAPSSLFFKTPAISSRRSLATSVL